MQIEIIGCTSAGKSTLTRVLLQACQEQGIVMLLGDEFVLKQLRLDWISSRLARNLLLNLAALFSSLLTWRKNLLLYRFSVRILLELPIPSLEKLYLFRNILKKTGVFEIISYYDTGQQVIWVDEGTMQIAHNLFVHSSVHIKTEQISTFAMLIPLPEVIVYLRQPESVLIDRVKERGHKRLPDSSPSNVTHFIRQAVLTFDTLMQEPAVESQLLVIDGDQNIVASAQDQSNPQIDLALEIIQGGIASGMTHTEPRNTRAPHQHNVTPPLSPLRELET